MRLDYISLPMRRLVSWMRNYVSILPPFKFRLCSLFILLVGIHTKVVRAQTDQINYTITYVADSKTYYQFTDSLAGFNIADQVKLLPEIVKDSVIREVYKSNKFKVTVHHLENNMFEEWMTQPGKTIIDAGKMTLYAKDGSVILSKPHSKKYKQKYSEVKNFLTENNEDIIPAYVYLTTALKNVLADSGYSVTELEDDYKKYNKDSIELIFNDQYHTNELIIYNSDGKFNFSVKKGFKYNYMGQLVPSYRIEKKSDERFGEHCVLQMKIIEYPYYIIRKSKENNRIDYPGNSLENEIAVTFFPNPVIDKLSIFVPGSADNLHLKIYDNTGRVVYENIIEKGVTELIVDLSSEQTGIYYIQVFNDKIVFTESFVKN